MTELNAITALDYIQKNKKWNDETRKNFVSWGIENGYFQRLTDGTLDNFNSRKLPQNIEEFEKTQTDQDSS